MLDKKFLYQGILKSLKTGTVPDKGYLELLVGREAELEAFKEEIIYVSKGGGSTRFIRGDYGSGKTFLAKAVRELAWEENFIVSWVELGRGVQFNKLENIYNKIIEGMRTRNYQDIPAFEYILQEWLTRLEEKVRYENDLNPLDQEDRKKINRLIDQKIEEVLQSVGAYSSSLANAIRGYYRASKERNNEVKAAAIGWIKGEKNIPAALKKEFNVKGSIDKENVLSFLNAIIRLIVEIKYSGLLIIIDETELIANIARRDIRDDAYENLRRIVDSTMNRELSHAFFLFTATESFFDNEETGVASYQALYQRISSLQKDDFKDLRQPIVSLDGLKRNDLLSFSFKIRDMHSYLYEWNAAERLGDRYINEIVERMVKRFGEEVEVNPRDYLRGFVDILDWLQQNPEKDVNKWLEKTESIIDELDEEELGESHVI